jgi:hypothetical protein
MYRRSVALDTFQPPMLWLNVAPAEENIELKLATEATFQLAMFWLNAGAAWNMLSSVVAEATFHEPMFALNAEAP